MDLLQSVGLLKGVGEKTEAAFNDAKIFKIKDLLYSLPKKYTVYLREDFLALSEEKKIIISGTVKSFVVKKMHYQSEMVILYLDVLSKNVKCIFFGQGFLKYNLRKGKMVSVCGTYNPLEKEIVGTKLFEGEKEIYIDIDYKISEVSNTIVTKLLTQIFNAGICEKDIMPQFLREKYKLLDFNSYLEKSHFPSSYEDIRQILRRRKYEDFLKYSISLKIVENSVYKLPKCERNVDLNLVNNFINTLPYKLTLSQKNAVDSVLLDIKKKNVMNRLIEGDVGSGKTIVAFIALLSEISAGYQVLLMAPTELLAKQHYEKFINLMKPYHIETRLLTSSVNKKYADEILSGLSDGRINCLISTQAALFHDKMFKNLGLIVIDEQHRFGVEQRSKLLNDNPNCDAIYLSATPIPRTLGLAHFGDLSLTELSEKPAGRKDVLTKIINFSNLSLIQKDILNEIEVGHQIFVVVSQIEEDTMDACDINKAYEIFSKLCPNATIGKLNGKLKEDSKNRIMNDFSNHKYDILISTTVIEVGIDIKDATMMFILNADRFGLSTLHQLRGRVGRNSYNSYCYLVTDKENNERLQALSKTNDCFELSEIDLKLRGPGDILGTNQSGFINLDFANDFVIYKCAKEDADILISKYPNEEIVLYEQSLISKKNNKLN